jgi:hypothetical protein
MTGTDLCVKKSQFVPVIFEPPCTSKEVNNPTRARAASFLRIFRSYTMTHQ